MVINLSNTIENVFNEAVTWEKAPINEMLNTSYASISNYSKQIILYGPTQVGKTTLIMDLIGIKNSCREELDKLLRGRSPAGSASTSSAIIYSRWNDDHFGISTKNIHNSDDGIPERLTAKEFEQRIYEINTRNHDFNSSDSNIADIYCYYIPEKYFDEDTELQNFQMIDLPGISERNEKMQKRAEEIIEYISGFVAGAIVVIKSDNIQSLESDYKKFITNHHLNHLAIAISYSASRNFDNKKIPDASATDEEIALNISKYYYDLIEDEGYMHFNGTSPKDIIFPLEKKDFLEKNYPHLTGPYEEIRKMLKLRIASMSESTAIKACTEQLDLEIKNSQQKIEKLKNQQASIEYEIENDCEAVLKTVREKQNLLRAELEQCIKQTGLLYEAKNSLKKRIEYFKENCIFDKNYAEGLWSHIKHSSEQDKKNTVYKLLLEEIDDCIGIADEYNTKETQALYNAVRHAMEKECEEFDIDEFLKGKGLGFFSRHSKAWYSKASSRMYDYYLSICEVGNNALNEKLNKLLKPLKKRQKELNTTIKQNELTLYNTENTIKNLSQEFDIKEEKIKELEKDIELKKDRQKRVKQIFAKHFYIKKRELEHRIEAEPNPEIKTALFLVLSSIYLSMKSCLEDVENEN